MSDKLTLSTYRPGLLPQNLGKEDVAAGIPFQILVSFASSEDGSQKTEVGKQKTEYRRQRTEIFSRLAYELESGKNLKQAFQHLNSTQQDSLREAIEKATLTELLSLSQETDKELFYESLLHFGVRLKSRNEFEKASVVFSLLGGAGPHPTPEAGAAVFDHPLPQGEGQGEGPIHESIRSAAEEEYNSIVGKGDIGRRLEVLSSRLARDACDWRMIVPMIGASALGATVTSSVLGRLVSNPTAGVFTRGIGARFSAGAVGYLAEFPAFAALGRVMAENSEGSFVEDLERSALAIGALKVFGWIGQKVGASLVFARPAEATLGGIGRAQGSPLQFLISQTSIFFGLLTSHKLEEKFNLRPHVDGATFVTDTLASMFTMSVGSHLGHRVLARSTQGREVEPGGMRERAGLRPAPTFHPSHPLLAALGTSLAAFFGTHWANAAWESAASDPSNFFLKAAALAIPTVLAMALSKNETSHHSKKLSEPQREKLEGIYKRYPELKSSLEKTGGSEGAIDHLLDSIEKKAALKREGSGNTVDWAYRGLSRVLDAMGDSGWSHERIFPFLHSLLNKPGPWVYVSFAGLPDALKGMKAVGWSYEQQTQFLLNLAEKAGHRFGHLGYRFPEILPAMKGLGLSDEQITQSILNLPEKEGESISDTVRGLPTAFQNVMREMESRRLP